MSRSSDDHDPVMPSRLAWHNLTQQDPADAPKLIDDLEFQLFETRHDLARTYQDWKDNGKSRDLADRHDLQRCDETGAPTDTIAEAIDLDEPKSVAGLKKDDTAAEVGDEDAYRNTARDFYGNDDLEIDDNAIVSHVQDGFVGAWVAAWVWISESDKDAVSDEDETTAPPPADLPQPVRTTD